MTLNQFYAELKAGRGKFKITVNEQIRAVNGYFCPIIWMARKKSKKSKFFNNYDDLTNAAKYLKLTENTALSIVDGADFGGVRENRSRLLKTLALTER